MTTIHKAIERIATWEMEMFQLIAASHTRIEGVAMARVIEFYIPNSFRKPMKWTPAMERGKVIEFCPQARKSA